MPPNKPVPGTPADWLSRAMGDLAIAQIALPEKAYYADLCFHAQQAAEKAIKAVYLHHKMIFRYTHDLEILITTLTQQGMDVPPKVKECAFLSVFAWETRYPGFEDSVTIEEYQYAIRKAEIVVAWAEQVLGS